MGIEKYKLAPGLEISRAVTGLWQIADMEKNGNTLDPTMNIIIPMAGRGSRLRPHTLTTAKPLLPVAGKPIVQRLVEDIATIVGDDLSRIAYVVGEFGQDVEDMLLAVAEGQGAKGSIHYQDKPLGTAHAVLCAAEHLEGPVVVAFADTLFRADFKLDASADGVIWVNRVEDPRAFGVVQLSEDGRITDFIEKPQEFVSDLAIIGIYYFIAAVHPGVNPAGNKAESVVGHALKNAS